jgi:hypothetical protein
MKLETIWASAPKLNKRGMAAAIVNTITGAAIGLLVLAGVMVGVTAFGGTQTAGTSARNLTDNIGQLTNKFGEQLPTVGTMFGVALILGAIGLIGLGIGVGARMMK